jgi:hypothetical protein
LADHAEVPGGVSADDAAYRVGTSARIPWWVTLSFAF